MALLPPCSNGSVHRRLVGRDSRNGCLDRLIREPQGYRIVAVLGSIRFSCYGRIKQGLRCLSKRVALVSAGIMAGD